MNGSYIAAMTDPAQDPNLDTGTVVVIRLDETVELLRSVRRMLVFFTVLAILGIIGGIIEFASLIHAANSHSGL